MTDQERKQQEDKIRELCGQAILKRLSGDKEAAPAADIAVALRWLDGLGRKGEKTENDNPYELTPEEIEAARQHGDKWPPVNTEQDDRASQ